MKSNRDIIEIKESMIGINEGLAGNVLSKRLYAKSDRAERNLRVAEKNHPEYKIKNAGLQKSAKEKDVELTIQQKAYALKSRDLTEARTLIKQFQNSKNNREKMDLLQEIYSLLENMPKKHEKTQAKESIYTAVGFGAFMFSFAVPLLLLLGTENQILVNSIIAASGSLAAYSTVKARRGITYAKNMVDNTVGVHKQGKENLQSMGKRDRFSGDLEKYRGVELDVDSEKERAKIERRKAFVLKTINKIKLLIEKEKKQLSLEYSPSEKSLNKERLRIGKLVGEGYFDGFNSVDEFVITEDGIIEEGLIKAGVKTLVLTTAILMGLSQMGISKEQVTSTLTSAGGKIVKIVDSNVDDMRAREDNVSKGLVITWDSGKKVLGTLSKKLSPIARKTISVGAPAMESAGADLLSKTASIASGLIDGFVQDGKVGENTKSQLKSISLKLKSISKEFGEQSQEKSQEVTSKVANVAITQINKASSLIPDEYKIASIPQQEKDS